MVETYILDNEIIISEEPEFMPCKNLEANIQYFVVCKKNQHHIGSIDAYDAFIAGEKIYNWVARACEDAQVLKINDYQNEFEAVKSSITECDYVVILNGNIPLINKQHLKDVVGYVIRKNMNACKLKSGFIFKTEYFMEVGEILSADVYNLKTNDFFEVVNFETLEIAKREINKRIFAFHSKNGANISPDSVVIDANVQIGYESSILEKSQILKETKICDNVLIGKNTIIEDSNIKDNCVVGNNVVVKNCVIGANVKIGDNVFLSGCEIQNGCEIHDCTKIIDSNIAMGVIIEKMCDLIGCEIEENATVGNMARLFKATIQNGYDVFDGKVIVHREDK